MVDAGDLVSYSVSISHDAASTSLLHDVALSDESYIDGTGRAYDSSPLFELMSVSVDGRGIVYNGTHMLSDVLVDPSRGLLAEIPSIALAETAIVHVTARVMHVAEAGAEIRPNAAVSYRTQPLATSPLAGSASAIVGADPQFTVMSPSVEISVAADEETLTDQALVRGQSLDITVRVTVPEATTLDAELKFELLPPGLLIPVEITSITASSEVTSSCTGGITASHGQARASTDGWTVVVPMCAVVNSDSNNTDVQFIFATLRAYVSASATRGDAISILGTFGGVGAPLATAITPASDLRVLEPVDLAPVARFPSEEVSTSEPYNIVVDILPQGFTNLTNSAKDVTLAVIVPGGFIDIAADSASVVLFSNSTGLLPMGSNSSIVGRVGGRLMNVSTTFRQGLTLRNLTDIYNSTVIGEFPGFGNSSLSVLPETTNATSSRRLIEELDWSRVVRALLSTGMARHPTDSSLLSRFDRSAMEIVRATALGHGGRRT